jgi:hypothetical protein
VCVCVCVCVCQNSEKKNEKDLPAKVSIVHVSNEKRLSGEGVRLDFDIRSSYFVHKGTLRQNLTLRTNARICREKPNYSIRNMWAKEKEGPCQHLDSQSLI